MINISNEYKNRVIGMFGQIGENWINNVPNITQKYIEKFNLKNVELISDSTYNILFFANNDEFGEIILKIELPFKELTIRESEALKINNGTGSCKCYYSNVDDGVILLERLLPGISLGTIDDLGKRVEIFLEVLQKFDVKLNNNNELPTYKEILNRSTNIAHEDKRFEPVLNHLGIANNLYKEIEEDNESNYLLHSDFHKDNILLSNNEWKAIDPHGFIGDKALDIAIFVQNELEKTEYSEQDITNILSIITKYCDVSDKKIIKALYVNYVLNLCWDIEVNFSDEHVNRCLKNSDNILSYYQSHFEDKKIYKKL